MHALKIAMGIFQLFFSIMVIFSISTRTDSFQGISSMS